MSSSGESLLSAWIIDRARRFATIGAFATLAVTFGCASSPPPPPPPSESALTAAGFKVMVAKTELQMQHLKNLTPGQITEMQRTGKKFYVFPDVARNQLYIGTPKEFAAYQKLQPGTPSPQSELNAQAAAGNSAYMKRDSTMELANQQVNTDPYYFWPTWEELWW